jgi:hypothetical protein
MQLKFQRSQRAGGVLGKTVIFCLDARADYSAAEAANISKYKLGGEVVYNSQAAKRHLDAMGKHFDRTGSDRVRDQAAGLARGVTSLALAKMHLNISIASLGRGHHIECKDLAELLDAEKALMDACRNLKQFLEAAATFNGSIILVDFDDGEKVHIAEGALQLNALPAPASIGAPAGPAMIEQLPHRPRSSGSAWDDFASGMRELYEDNTLLVHVAASILGALLILSALNVNTLSIVLAVLLVAGTVVWTLRRSHGTF